MIYSDVWNSTNTASIRYEAVLAWLSSRPAIIG